MRRKTTWCLAAIASFSITSMGAGACGGQASNVTGDAGDATTDGPFHHTDGQPDSPEDVVTVQDSFRPDVHPGDGGDASDTGPSDVTPPFEASGTPPPPPADTGPPGTTATNFAIHKLYLGDTDFGGKPGADPSAWQTMGYNVDGKITTASSVNVCTLYMGGGSFGKAAQVDGVGGIDNSFGENFYSGILLSIDSTASATVDTSLANGTWTEMFDVVGLSSSPTQTATGLSAQAFMGASFGAVPTFTTADIWPILTNDLTTFTPPFTSTRQFPGAYVVSGTWVSGPPGDIDLGLIISGNALPITVHQAVITFDHTSATHAANGIISGVLFTSELVTALRALAGAISPSLCSGTTLDPIIQQIEASQDILSDGTNPAGAACDAISIGVGFTADAIAQPTTAVTVCPPSNPCLDGGGPICDAGGGPG